MSSRRKQKRVLLALGWYDYRVHRGIERFALEHGWHLSADVTREKIIPWGWEGDGILAWLGAGDDLAQFVVRAKRPTVDFSFRRPQLKFPRVLEDHARTAQLVAEHFLTRGFKHFVFYSDTDNWSYNERGQYFVAALKAAGHDCQWLRWHEAPASRSEQMQWRRKRGWLTTLLKKSPKPLSVFAANDQHALDVLDCCADAQIPVPEAVAIVGSENYLLANDAMHTPVSSVDTNLELLGYRGAALLHDLMNGQPPPKAPLRIPPAGLVARKSSDLLTLTHQGVAKSLRFIWEHASGPISIKDLVGVAGMSRRGLHTAFVQQLGRTPGEELQRVRIERAKKLLAEPGHKMEELAEICGYQSATSFSFAFRQATGKSPKQYRDSLHR